MSQPPEGQPQVSTPPLVQPTASMWQFGIATAPNGVELVTVVINTATGTFVVFLSPDEAESNASALTQTAKQIKTGLALPPKPSGLINPNGAPLRSVRPEPPTPQG